MSMSYLQARYAIAMTRSVEAIRARAQLSTTKGPDKNLDGCLFDVAIEVPGDSFDT